MKAKLSRRESREQAFLLAFERNFNHETVEELCETAVESRDFEVDDFAIELLKQIENNEDEINNLIESNSKGWKIKRISKVALSILQLAISELKYTDVSKIKAQNPVSVVINEAVLIAKKYSTSEESAFINGVLGSIVRLEDKNEQ
ncbi:MAG: transcription antitermination factor NusB [Acutalibacteraceae bacterium]|nr:transcription antitermination factor NusB [Acutalibacteraceae bacterium]